MKVIDKILRQTWSSIDKRVNCGRDLAHSTRRTSCWCILFPTSSNVARRSSSMRQHFTFPQSYETWNKALAHAWWKSEAPSIFNAHTCSVLLITELLNCWHSFSDRNKPSSSSSVSGSGFFRFPIVSLSFWIAKKYKRLTRVCSSTKFILDTSFLAPLVKNIWWVLASRNLPVNNFTNSVHNYYLERKSITWEFWYYKYSTNIPLTPPCLSTQKLTKNAIYLIFPIRKYGDEWYDLKL